MGVARLDIVTQLGPDRPSVSPRQGKTVHWLFEIGLAGKLVDGSLEILAAIVLYGVGAAQLSRWVRILAEHELTEDPDNVIATFIAQGATHFSANSQLFAVLFLLGHGVVKVGLVVALFRQYRWAYPLAMVIFGLFVVYQIYRYFHTDSVWLLGLSALDVFVIVLTWFEYKRMGFSVEWRGYRA